LNNTTIWKMVELKNTNIIIKSINGWFNIETPYFTAWNVDAIKYYINMLSGTNDKEVTINQQSLLRLWWNDWIYKRNT
jgi:hypothetical protein